MSTFIPPFFADLGKSASDLFKKKFDYSNTVATKNKTLSGLVFTTTGDLSTPNGIAGTIKVNHSDKKYGKTEAEISTAGSAKGKVTLDTLLDGTVVHVSANNKPSGTVTAEYRQDFFAGTASYETSFFNKNKLNGSGVIGFDGLSVGGSVTFDLMGGSDVEDYNVGAQYATRDYTAAIRTENKGEFITGSYFLQVSPVHQIGASLNSNLVGQLATEYRVDARTSVKARADTNGVVDTAVEHRLANPKVLINFASQFQAGKNLTLAPSKFGVGLTFGDYN